MCGISGFYKKEKISPVVLNKFKNDSETIQHKRGPDFFGSYVNKTDNIGLFHNRLSLVDLSSKGNQPMEKHGFVISFNGEIYNFRQIRKELESLGYEFNSATDTEVILSAYHRWGTKSFDKFNGAYAFALYDMAKDIVFLVRDKIGEKPLYYLFDQSKEELVFASNIQLLLTIKKNVKLNKNRIISDLVFNFWSDKSETHFSGINILSPGTYLEHGKSVKVVSYWDILPTEVTIREEDALEKINAILEDAINMRVQLDTKIASILSGGIDSSLMSVIAQKYLNYSLDCYTLKKKGYDDEDIISASRISKERKWNHHQVEVRPEDLGIKNASYITDAMEEPILDQVYIYINRNYEEAHKDGFKAVLNGQGADEIFLGYLDYYPFLRNSSNYDSYESFRNFWYEQFSLKGFINKDSVFASIDENLSKNFKPYQTKDYLNSVLRFGTKTHLPALLLQEDKQSLNWSVECRTVYTDYRLVEYLSGIPSQLKYADGREKYLLRKIAKKYLPDYIINRKKLGFPNLPDGRDLLVTELIKKGYLKKSELISKMFSPKIFDNIEKLPFSIRWKLCSIAVFESVLA